jgi:Zn-dependent peptidase ImmA (M78 family)
LGSSAKLSTEDKQRLYQAVVPIASEYRNKILDESERIEDSFSVLEELGFFIIRFPADESLSGFHIKKSGKDCIFINSRHPLGRQYFSSWHEYYHAVTGEGGGISLKNERDYDEIEYKAECFASCILMPEGLVRDYLIKNRINLRFISHNDVINMQNFFRVSYSAMVTRLIQIFPEHIKVLRSRYGLGSIKRKGELLSKTVQAEGDILLIQPTYGVILPQSFYGNVTYNLENNRISKEKGAAIWELIDSIKVRDED